MKKIIASPVKAVLDLALQQPKIEEGLYSFLRRFQMYIRSRARLRALSAAGKHLMRGETWVVKDGPFNGMKFPVMPERRMQFMAPQLIGSYESELHATINSFSESQYRAIINIGAGWGYYSTGLARRFPATPVYAFEADADRRRMCRRVAELNGVDETVEVRGRCGTAELRGLLGERRDLLAVDCEGCEVELLSVDRIEALRYCDLLVELHDYAATGPTTGEVLSERFSATHDVVLINRRREQLNYVKDLGISDFRSRGLQYEPRIYSVGWLFLKSKMSRQ